jgi:hypothetical protein
MSFDQILDDMRNGVFISHITQEKPVALVLQKYIKRSFGSSFRVFVSSDAKSIGGGTPWFNHIIENLRLSRCYLVLVSQESKRREWINFEAGFGYGCGSVNGLVIPVAVKRFPLSQLSYPMAGIQGRAVENIGLLLEEIGNYLGNSPEPIDTTAYLKELAEAEARLVYKSLVVTPVLDDGRVLRFDIQNVGNVDLELLMLEAIVPVQMILPGTVTFPSKSGIDSAHIAGSGGACRWFGCYSQRGTYRDYPPLLRPIITPSMGAFRPRFMIPLKALTADTPGLSISFQVHAADYPTQRESIKLVELGK